jgi:cell division septation protein DedD
MLRFNIFNKPAESFRSKTISDKSVSDKSSSKKRYKIELTPLSITLWSVFFLILLSWSFFLGILLGQGFMPGAVTAISDLKGQVNKIQDMVKTKESSDPRPAAKPDIDPKLAFYERLANKKEEAKKENTTVVIPKVEPAKPKVLDVPYTVQVASLESEESASDMTGQLIRKGYPAYFYMAVIDGKALYRVRCGRFQTREEAERYIEKLVQEAGIKGFVSRIE